MRAHVQSIAPSIQSPVAIRYCLDFATPVDAKGAFYTERRAACLLAME